LQDVEPLRGLRGFEPCAQDSGHYVVGQMIHVLCLGSELFPAGNAARDYNPVAALGDAGRIVHRSVPLVPSNFGLRVSQDFPFRPFVHEIEDSARIGFYSSGIPTCQLLPNCYQISG
jgi:hypothetical protein